MNVVTEPFATLQNIRCPRKNTKVTGVATGTSKKSVSGGNVGGGDTLSNTNNKMKTTMVPKMGNGEGKEGGAGHKTVDDVQNRDKDGLVAAVDDVDQGGDNTEQVVSPMFMLFQIIY